MGFRSLNLRKKAYETRKLPNSYRALARKLIEAVGPTLADLGRLRAQSYVILACGHLYLFSDARAVMGDPDAAPMPGWQSCSRATEPLAIELTGFG